MSKIKISETQNPAIIKFVLQDFITKGENFEFKNIDETSNSPLAKELFFLPFVKTVYISNDFIAIERFSIVEWSDVHKFKILSIKEKKYSLKRKTKQKNSP